MKYFYTFLLLSLITPVLLLSATKIVNHNGGEGSYTTIQAAITAATAGDTVKVLPGTYSEQVTLNINIVLMGSGYENTIITGPYNPSVSMNAGTLQWFRITSLTGNGISPTGGIIKNNVIISCAGQGISITGGSVSIINCTILNNGGNGVYTYYGGNSQVVNTISRNNAGTGFWFGTYYGGSSSVNYSDGSRTSSVSGNIGDIDSDPLFTSTANLDFHISSSSPCWNKGNPSLADPDGSVSDMGYFGGPDCPVFPVVNKMVMQMDGGNVQIQVTGKANY
jgi:hypothetical protein